VSGNVTVDGNNTITNVQTSRTTQASLNQTITPGTGNFTLNNNSYYSVAAAVQQTAPTSLGVSRTLQTMTGFVDGLVDSITSGGNMTTRSIGTSGDNATISLTTTPSTNSVDATITAKGWGGVSGSTATFRLGGGVALNATSLFVDDGTYAARDVPSNVGTPTSVSVTSGNTTVTSTASDLTSSTVLVSQGVAPVTTFLTQSGVTNVCDCKYLTWGWWGGSVSYAGNQTLGLNINPGGIDRINMATYVAGNTSSFNDINVSAISTNNGQQSTATYNGQLIGNVNNNGASYIAAGSYSNAWSFGTKTGTLNVTFDGSSFSGATALTGNTSSFSSGNITSGSRTLNLNGSFFNGQGANTTALYQAGRFGVAGTNYQAAGTFAAQRTP